MEIWQEFYPDVLTTYLPEVDSSPLGLIGQTGWYFFVPDSLLELNPVSLFLLFLI